MPKTIEQYFCDWESSAFGYGYGTGEPHVLRSLKNFFDAFDEDNTYDYVRLEEACGAPVAWLLINRLCAWGIDVIEYGVSPRYAWLTEEGKRLRAFVAKKTVGELVDICCKQDDDNPGCLPDVCNCHCLLENAGLNREEDGPWEGPVCPNPFWPRRKPRVIERHEPRSSLPSATW